jgi:hypothetical protein
MEEQFIEAVDKVIEQVILDFRGDPAGHFSEREIHWALFRYLKQEEVFQRSNKSELIRAEFPTRATYGERKPARGHYDLVVLEPASLDNPALSEISPLDSSDRYLELVKIMIAIEVKAWWYRWKDFQQKIDWDIEKLVDSRNGAKYLYSLNFVLLDFSRQGVADYYRELREYLAEQAKKYPKLKILCLPSDPKIQPESDNWISVPK